MSARRLPRATTLSDPEIWEVVWANRGLCYESAKEYAGRGLDREDLVQEGLFGLRRAAELFDGTRTGPDGKPVAFSTYAVCWIRVAMSLAIETQGRAVRVPRRTGQDAARVRAGKATLDDFGRARRCCVLAAMAVGGVGSLAPRPDGFDGHADSHPPARPDRIDPAEWAEAEAALDRLPPRDREIIRLRYGLGEYGSAEESPRTLRQVGALVGLTAERVRQIEKRAKRRLRAELDPEPELVPA